MSAVAVTEQERSVDDLIHYIWSRKYRYETDDSLDATKHRIASAAAGAEQDFESWTRKFLELMNVFLPGGRAINSLGTGRRKATAFNCYVSQVIDDSMDGIFDSLHKAALTMQAGGGVGFDFSTLRPKGAAVKGVGSTSSGPISFMKVFDSMCSTIAASGHRRGAMMAVMRIDHPDIEEFVTAKKGDENKALQNFNLSVLVTDSFIQAVRENREWSLVFNGQAHRTIAAKDLWNLILQNAYDYAEPGVLFIDRVNGLNNLWYEENITSTNPCGEQPLPPNGACNLGSLNLAGFVDNPFTTEACFNEEHFGESVALAVRYLDDVIEIAHMPLKEQLDEVKGKRRIGLGITGLGDALWMLGLQYGTPESVEFCRKLGRFMRDTAYRASVCLAAEKGSFPHLDRDKYLSGAFVSKLPADIREGIREHGIRNSHLLTIAPTGTTSLLWGNISSGVEPILYLTVEREIRESDDKKRKVTIDDYAYRVWKSVNGNEKEPEVLISSQISAKGHIDIMAAFQEFFDASISKTIVFDPNTSFEDFRDTYLYAYEKGIKGCTVYRDSGKLGAVVKAKDDGYVKPMELPGERVKRAIQVDIPNEGAYEVEVTVVENQPREVWLHAPVEQSAAALIEAVVRLSSIMLRCNIDPRDVMKQLRKANMSYGSVSNPLAYIERALLRVMGSVGVKSVQMNAASRCPSCGGVVVMEESCLKCSSCEWNKCS
jgi:ribonucleoside-diphosphate reductase alpha chain